jgi:alpha-L-fucosidase
MTMNTTWGYSEHDHAWKSDETLIRNLIDIVSKGGNYLLNIGPRGDGSVPEESVKSMQAIGRWLRVNGESIYGTSASLFPTLSWGRSTTKGQTIYLHVFHWPKDGKLLVPGLRSKVRSARLLASGEKLATRSSDEGVTVLLPAAAPDPVASVIALSLHDTPHVAN